ncbi:hypothetical protein D3C76_1666440 [compost metagenome]
MPVTLTRSCNVQACAKPVGAGMPAPTGFDVSPKIAQLVDFACAIHCRDCAPSFAGIDFADCSPKAPCGPADRPRA